MSPARAAHTFGASRNEASLAPYRILALHVISLAVRDLITPGRSTPERKTARTFFSGSRMLNHWCRLADIDPNAIRKHLRDALEENDRNDRLDSHRRH